MSARSSIELAGVSMGMWSSPGADPAALGGSATLEGGSSAAAIAAGAGNTCGPLDSEADFGGGGGGTLWPLDVEADFGGGGGGNSKSERLRFRLSSWPWSCRPRPITAGGRGC